MIKKTSRSILLMIFLIIASAEVMAQKVVDMDSGPSFKDRIYTGGGFGFSASNYQTQLSVSPLIGYMITRKLSAGVGITYQYYNNSFYKADDHRYGGKIFAMQALIHQFFLYGEYNFINLNRSPWDETNPRETFTRTLLGAGFSQPLGRASFNVIAAYDITWNKNSAYGSPWSIGAFISI